MGGTTVVLPDVPGSGGAKGDQWESSVLVPGSLWDLWVSKIYGSLGVSTQTFPGQPKSSSPSEASSRNSPPPIPLMGSDPFPTRLVWPELDLPMPDPGLSSSLLYPQAETSAWHLLGINKYLSFYFFQFFFLFRRPN